jgi:oxygen-dependent protoporphyrinogen oxidase
LKRSSAHRPFVVVGGGVSGLAAAATLVGAEPASGISVIVCEREGELGGKARTLELDDFRIETGPVTFLDDTPALTECIRSAGLEEERVRAQRVAGRRFLIRAGRMREVPAHPLRFIRSGPLGLPGLLRLLAEPLVPRAAPDRVRDETVEAFARRRLGARAAERLVTPLVRGVWAGDPAQLSVVSAFPRWAELERTHGSLLRGMLAGRRGGAAGAEPRELGSRAPSSFRGGIEALPRALAALPGVEVRLRTTVRSITRAGQEWRVEGSVGPPIEAAGVILAGEARPMAALLAPTAPRTAQALRTLHSPPVTIVALGYPAASAARFPEGFGALAAPGAGVRLLGTLWDGRIFPDRSPPGQLLVRVIYGGSVDPESAALDDDRLAALAHSELDRLLGLPEPPRLSHVIRWSEAIPQYDLAHLTRRETAEEELASLPGLELAGTALSGVSFGKAVEAGTAAAARLLATRARGASAPGPD